MKILVLNCGSSSIKYQLIEIANSTDLKAKGLLDRIGLPTSELTHQVTGKEKHKIVQEVPDHQIGINLILKTLKDPVYGVIKDENEILAVGHRVAHGGENFKASVLITPDVKLDIEKCIELAPLHNPANLKGIQSIEAILPNVPQVAVFDTSFHQTMPPFSYLYAIPYEYYENFKIRRYGFHGTSHKYIAQKACRFLGKDIDNCNIITCHLGNGSSIAAIQNGKSVDTSMGFTPLEGLMMGTRSGDVDLGVLLFIAEKENLSIADTNAMFNKKSGIFGISGISFDMRDVEQAAEKGNKRAQLALDMYAYRAKKYIGAYAAAMGGVDLIILSGGIGENDISTRQRILEGLQFLGVEFDAERNNSRGKEAILTRPGSPVTAMVQPTNEELVIAIDTFNIVTQSNFNI
ncbi:MAG: acetate kinase [Bacteroidales bacterium]|nr:acetate kinase [Bacteroidales bacterium]MDD4602272.1 acetate kinase [Bacteroidales bacterium]